MFLVQSKAVQAQKEPDILAVSTKEDKHCSISKEKGVHDPCARRLINGFDILENTAKMADKIPRESQIPSILKQKRKARFIDPIEPLKKLMTRQPDTPETKTPSSTAPSVNLGALKNPCEYLRRKCRDFETSGTYSTWIAFLQRPKRSRYVFYISKNIYLSQMDMSSKMLKRNMSLYDYLQTESKTSVTIVQQFKLSIKLAYAVLQFHSTPWLSEDWKISQLRLMPPPSGTKSEDISLYLNSRLASHCQTSTAEDVQMKDSFNSPFSAAHRRGMFNTTLFCLGMAFLEIGHWKIISNLVEGGYSYDDFDKVWMLAERTMGLGRLFDEITKKCLRCDFAFGTDLRRVELQRAIYSDVICPLEELVLKLDNLNN
jgi:hypothetical protein